MHVELTPERRDLLLHLVDVAIRELGPEIRHTSTRAYKDELKDHRLQLRGLHDLLIAATVNELDAAPTDAASHGLVGTP